MNMIDYIGALPEILLLALLCVVLLVGVFSTDEDQNAAYWLAQFALLAVFVANTNIGARTRLVLFDGMYIRDSMAIVLKDFILAFAIIGLVYARDYLRARRIVSAEFYVLALMAILGMMVLVSAGSLLTVYLGLELLSLSLYAMVAMHRNSAAASEAAMKYFVVGALASGLLLYGISMLYGITGSVDIGIVRNALAGSGGNPLATYALVFIVAGVAFKLGAVPFHMWIPDVYEGAPTAVTMFIATAPKITAFAMAMRLLVDGLQPLALDWQVMLTWLAVGSMLLGNIVAIVQSNIKRMLAYSTIAHMGFLLLGVLSANTGGYAGAMFYAIVYALMTLGAFGVVMLVAGEGSAEADRILDFKGLAQRSPWFALVMLIMMFSLAGVPPFAGFWAKWFVIKEVIAAGYVWLAGLAVLSSIIGAYYYLQVIRMMYFEQPEYIGEVHASGDMEIALSANGVAVLLLGVMPGLLMAVCIAAMRG
ncbi:MAG: NADH-quinone oxidoreductase subunit N [Gammaproteobacteria bacterium]|nr:NADH-quinone oxidoreductase subunit N [Gammaproteobacteria bacterium]